MCVVLQQKKSFFDMINVWCLLDTHPPGTCGSLSITPDVTIRSLYSDMWLITALVGGYLLNC